MKRNLLLGVAIVLIGLYMSGCSAKMATQQPDKKNIDLFKVGTERSMILAEFGMPIASEERSGKKYEIFTFIQGYSTGAKAGRALFHGAADVMTLGLWEVVGTSAEGAFDGSKMAYEISYDDDFRVDSVNLLKKK